AALRADAAQSALCAYLSLIALAGLAINAIWRVKWADPIAALARFIRELVTNDSQWSKLCCESR
ncbi:MAG: cation transporter, partial [Candidatus Sulfotelmatobacter sp.]